MKTLLDKLLTWLNSIGKDKYQHFAVGATLAAVSFIVPLWLGSGAWLSLLLSMLGVVIAALVKERKIDPRADLRDILWTLAGGAAVWAAAIALSV